MAQPNVMISAYIPHNILRGFDRLCRMLGKTRTAMLSEIMRAYVLNEGGQIAEQDRILSTVSKGGENRFRPALETQSGSHSANPPFRQGRLLNKRFSDFLREGLNA